MTVDDILELIEHHVVLGSDDRQAVMADLQRITRYVRTAYEAEAMADDLELAELAR